jgi:hypothetical protein
MLGSNSKGDLDSIASVGVISSAESEQRCRHLDAERHPA